MAKTTLPTNYVDDVLNGAMDGKRRYREIPNADGTISLEDATTYDQIGNNFGASQVNLMNDNINQSFDANKMLKTMDEVNAVTQEGYGVDALVVKELNNSLENNLCFLYEPPMQTGGQGVYTFNVPENYEILAITPYCNNGGFYVYTSYISGNEIDIRLVSAGGTGTNVTVGIKVLVKNK